MDFPEIHAYLTERIKSFDFASHSGPGGSDHIERIEIGYECAQTRWVAVVFDPRPEAKIDGE